MPRIAAAYGAASAPLFCYCRSPLLHGLSFEENRLIAELSLHLFSKIVRGARSCLRSWLITLTDKVNSARKSHKVVMQMDYDGPSHLVRVSTRLHRRVDRPAVFRMNDRFFLSKIALARAAGRDPRSQDLQEIELDAHLEQTASGRLPGHGMMTEVRLAFERRSANR
jgi:hypothetical protein